MVRFFIVLFYTVIIVLSAFGKQTANFVEGFVFLDENKNGIFDSTESGIAGVYVSNGKDVVQTDAKGKWELSIEETRSVFVIKPANYSVPLNQNKIPQHYFLLDENGSKSKFNFPLYSSPENSRFSTLFFADTQARGVKEVSYIFHDVAEELIGTDASFGVSLGDIVADEPKMMTDVAAGVAQIGIPWYNIFGNHDNDRDAKSNQERDKTFQKYFGPSTYAFEYGEVVFIGLNNIFFKPDGSYISHFTNSQLTFVENYLDKVPKTKLVVLMMHSPIVNCDNRDEMFRLIEDREHTFSISGHLHEQVNLFVDNRMGWKGKVPHHHLINATVSGSWWCGLKDEVGIPHATMNDGAPNGYSIVTFDGNKYSVQFKAARRPENYQMNIYLQDEIAAHSIEKTKVLVNVFAGSERSLVEMSINNGNWIQMDMCKTIDPEVLRMHSLSPLLNEVVNDQSLDEVFGWSMDYPSVSQHIWEAALPTGIMPGTHTVSIRSTDMYKQSHLAHRIFKVK